MSVNNIERINGDMEKDQTMTTANDNTNREEMPSKDSPADFDQAIEAAGFGLFNFILFLVAILATFASNFESSSVSYILPVAECDLQLTLNDKGVLNAVGYGGMIFSAIAWGYLADTKGRRKVLLYGYWIDMICVFGSALSQNFWMLVLFKFLGGLVINGPAAVLFTYLTEMHGPKHRSSVLMVVGMITSLSMLVLPLLAWGVFPRDWDFQLFGYLNIHSWQIYLFICGLPSLFSGLIFIVMPESPRYLMAHGRNEEALKTFQLIYVWNTRKSKETYPIKTLVQETPVREAQKDEAIFTIEENNVQKIEPKTRSCLQSLKAGCRQMKPMFLKPLLGLSLHCYTMQFCIFLGMNTIRLWLPQLFASIAEYETLYEDDAEVSSASMCSILEYSVQKQDESSSSIVNSCTEPLPISMAMYMNNIIVSSSGFVGYLFAGFIVRALGANRLLTYGLFASGLLGFALYFSISSQMTLIISATFQTITIISFSSLLGAVVALFPTQLRSLVVAIAMMWGRLGSVCGNLLFPVLMTTGCMPPFIMVSSVLLVSGVLSIYLPNPANVKFS
ncbi:synaptic vesicle glycoprotein 2C-like [Drosophila tropicalis]|uniref:synaptic vesicle glycoprotein 2C-like n=1 Tax=Drosophila tropicalis TaxID=46794 RepID=UPI0035ABF680